MSQTPTAPHDVNHLTLGLRDNVHAAARTRNATGKRAARLRVFMLGGMRIEAIHARLKPARVTIAEHTPTSATGSFSLAGCPLSRYRTPDPMTTASTAPIKTIARPI